MYITKRTGISELYDGQKIINAISKAFRSTGNTADRETLLRLLASVEEKLSLTENKSVEVIQDLVEQTLMEHGCFAEAKNYILFRQKRSELRAARNEIVSLIQEQTLDSVLAEIQNTFSDESYSLRILAVKFVSFFKNDMPQNDRFSALVRAAVELISPEAPNWEFIAARLLNHSFRLGLERELEKRSIKNLYEKIQYLTAEKLYGEYILASYSKAEIEQANAKLYEAKIKKNNLDLDLRTATSEEQSLRQAQNKRSENVAKATERIKVLEGEKLSSQAKLAAQRDALAALEVAENKMRGDLNLIKTEFDEKSTALNKRKARINELTLKAHDLENALGNHRRQKTAIINNLLESWNITPQEAQMKWGEVKVDYERVKMMRKRIENMGAVNMTAPEEYDALTQRNDFLKKQIEDLGNAKRDLKAAIIKINATTKENFKYTFDQVRTHFQSVYQTLFVGGEAELTLTDPENLLETGVEITVQPPGKKLLNISALSGGEKALTAVSLLFAFFTHNPSPFCILDEADAPLDEANVERFTNLIKEFSSKTQFIVVTHNKRTMEAAQMLYGVTMEESGVSKVLSLNLKDQDSKTRHLVAAASE